MKQLTQESKSLQFTGISYLLALILLLGTANAQQVKTMKVMGGGDVFMLEEIGGIITETEDGLRVEMVMPADNRAEQYKTTDIPLCFQITMCP